MSPSRPPRHQDPAHIYFLPNLMTAGNLICGFLAILHIIEGTLQRQSGGSSDTSWVQDYTTSLLFILGAFIFDMLDGRLARLGGRESAFGREFDSIADVVSFGVAPALLVFKIVLLELDKLGWIVALFYLLCGAMRLARFNVLATLDAKSSHKEFTGFPIPAAAGTIASITLLMLHLYETRTAFQTGSGKWALAALMVFLSVMMMSTFRYPSFKSISWRTHYSMPKFVVVVGCLVLLILYYKYLLAVAFVTYLLYGFVRPFLSRAMRREIEDDEADADEEEDEEEGKKEQEEENAGP